MNDRSRDRRHPTKERHYADGYREGIQDIITACLTLKSTADAKARERFGSADPLDRLVDVMGYRDHPSR